LIAAFMPLILIAIARCPCFQNLATGHVAPASVVIANLALVKSLVTSGSQCRTPRQLFRRRVCRRRLRLPLRVALVQRRHAVDRQLEQVVVLADTLRFDGAEGARSHAGWERAENTTLAGPLLRSGEGSFTRPERLGLTC